MVKQLVISPIDYCNVLYVNLPKKLIKKLRSVLNNGIRFIFDIKDQSQDLIPYYKEAHILPIEHRISFKVCLMCFKAIHGMVPAYFDGLVELDQRERPSTRLKPAEDNLCLKVQPLPTTLKGARRFSYQAPIIWNAIPLRIRSLDHIDSFKKALKTHFFTLIDL